MLPIPTQVSTRQIGVGGRSTPRDAATVNAAHLHDLVKRCVLPSFTTSATLVCINLMKKKRYHCIYWVQLPAQTQRQPRLVNNCVL